ncbi:hypothetical protein C882_3518 [Caenispirillum salinarum AK4]|uniref:MobA-like NTP transferase domain-containing protein n=1 Tax=Caenispirillum salinarum AK4 TaxID=1238182 RepID=K9H2G7_9PROT|nr:nucleotidyltransferase family protein [Caenispirillum salinarum]EKV31767.1 hypothetical protein C882_3518 [Caenispirillum salinarum AK4]
MAASLRPPALRVAALIPAAGASSRMGRDKLAAQVAGRPMLARVADCLMGAGLDPLVVVCRGADDPRRAILDGRPVLWADNPAWADGMGTSIAAGVAALPEGLDGVAVCPGDMPLLTASDVMTVLAAFDGQRITAARHEGRRGHPVIFPTRLFPQLLALTGDAGARAVVGAEHDRLALVDAGPGCLVDVDTPADLAAVSDPPPPPPAPPA